MRIMNTRIDIKSALLGLCVGVVAMLVMAAASASPSGSVGRYQITGTTSHALVLDTTTGEVWHGFYPTDRGGTSPDFLKQKNSQK
jgi:hypothetical protein